MNAFRIISLELDVLALIAGYGFGGMTGLGVAATAMFIWTVVGLLSNS